jgi:hypothetical protein
LNDDKSTREENNFYEFRKREKEIASREEVRSGNGIFRSRCSSIPAVDEIFMCDDDDDVVV